MIDMEGVEVELLQAGVEVELLWKPFQLSPESSIEGEDKMTAYMKKFGPDFKNVLLDPNNHVFSRARALGAEMKYVEGSKVFNTIPVHSLLHWTQEKFGTKKANELHEVLFRKYHGEGLNLGPNEELLKAAAEVGLPVAEVETMLNSGELTAEIQKEVQKSRSECSGVPYFKFPNGKTISGGVAPDAFVGVLGECAQAA